MIQFISPRGKTILTDLTPELEALLLDHGILWFELRKKRLSLSQKAFDKVDKLLFIS